MKVAKLLAVAAASVALSVVSGCFSGAVAEGRPRDIVNVSYTLAAGRTFSEAVNSAAVFRRWTPRTLDNGTIRCTLEQRQHRVVVDVVPANGTFSIICVESNIPNRKYDQWANNLCREIVARAIR